LFLRGGHHKNRKAESGHYTLRGFKSDGFAYQTIHTFSSGRSTVFANGGKVWKDGGRRLDVEWDCEFLWCILICYVTSH
ncbi:hypothetical protein M413DRAFT_79726, partial [Hebeloma cylindrosporum]